MLALLAPTLRVTAAEAVSVKVIMAALMPVLLGPA